jgi:NADH dehydrogenase
MKIAITGGTGFVGGHLARALVGKGHHIALIARGVDRRDPHIRHLPNSTLHAIGTDDEEALVAAFAGCAAIAHCAGINREIGNQTYARVHVQGTRNVVNAARRAGVRKIVLLSFLRARPRCGSGYHESKWAAEDLVRGCGLDHTILKAGVIYGRGDHMLDHLSHAFHTFPIFGLVGFKDQLVRPLAVEDLGRVLQAALVDGRLSRQTVAVLGPEQLTLSDAVRRVAQVVGKRPWIVRLPLWFHYAFAWVAEQIMVIPLVSVAQVRILSEGMVESLPESEPLPTDLQPRLPFTPEQIRRGLPEAKSFSLTDCRWLARLGKFSNFPHA